MCRIVLLFLLVRGTSQFFDEKFFNDNRHIAKAVVEALQDRQFNDQLTFDLKKENQVFLNRTMSLLIKYIVKREVDFYRKRRAEAISRKIYSALVMKLIDIARDLPRNQSATQRIDTAHHYYMTVESRDLHDEIADRQVFHVCARLYDILFTAPRIFTQLGRPDDLTSRNLVRRLQDINVKPVHLAAMLVIQYHLRRTVNYAIHNNVLEVLSAEPHKVGPATIGTLKDLAALVLPVVEMLDVHLAHSSPMFRDSCPSTWLGIVNHK
ncbi:uncharacterized protein LOC125240722 [Leguminivora glycinivorella]|uniref:uncharacterized protein LOC125240722 n=1 Tax=Leguminivora glycinivorella TaxID=1035111 RepID=UPI0020103E72|nr:uncharacterized protein LOC125240722 [Leguminivora glycinivorella]